MVEIKSSDIFNLDFKQFLTVQTHSSLFTSCFCLIHMGVTGAQTAAQHLFDSVVSRRSKRPAEAGAAQLRLQR